MTLALGLFSALSGLSLEVMFSWHSTWGPALMIGGAVLVIVSPEARKAAS